MVSSKIKSARPKTGGPKGRRGIGRALLGGLVVLGCSFASAAITLRSQVSASALAVQRDLPAGHTLAAGDVRAVQAATGPDVPLIHTDAASVIGRQLTVPLVSGALLLEKNLGRPAYPQPGYALIGVAVKPGQFPPDLSPGDNVSISTISGDVVTRNARAVPQPVVAVVTKVAKPEQVQNPTVVTLLLAQNEARLVSEPAAQGLATLMQISPAAR